MNAVFLEKVRILLSDSFSRRLDRAIRFFLYLMVLSFAISLAGVEISVAAAILLWLVKHLRAAFHVLRMRDTGVNWGIRLLSAMKPPVNPLNKFIGIFLGAAFLASVFGVMPKESIHAFFSKTMEWFLIFWLVVEVLREQRHLRSAVKILSIGVFVVAVDSIIQVFGLKYDIFAGRLLQEGFRATGPFSVSNILAAFLSMSIPPVCGWVLIPAKVRYRVVKIILFVGVLITLGLTYTRGAWIALILGCALWFVIGRAILGVGKNSKIFGRSVTGLIGVFILILGLLIFLPKDRFAYLKSSGTLDVRVGLWKDSLRMLSDRPVLGFGINTYMRTFQKYRRDPQENGTFAHNSYVQLMCETGLAGLSAFLVMIGYYFYLFGKKIRSGFGADTIDAVLARGIFCGLLVFYLHSFVDNHFYNTQVSGFWWYMMGLGMVLINNFNQQDAAHESS